MICFGRIIAALVRPYAWPSGLSLRRLTRLMRCGLLRDGQGLGWLSKQLTQGRRDERGTWQCGIGSEHGGPGAGMNGVCAHGCIGAPTGERGTGLRSGQYQQKGRMAVLKQIGQGIERRCRAVVQDRGSRKVEHDRAGRRHGRPDPGTYRGDECISVIGR
jgi:hypothetical protein